MTTATPLAFFDDEPDLTTNISQQTEINDVELSTQSDDGFGFFDDTPSEAVASAEDDGFGFFDEPEMQVSTPVASDNSYGFFDTTELPENKATPDNSEAVISPKLFVLDPIAAKGTGETSALKKKSPPKASDSAPPIKTNKKKVWVAIALPFEWIPKNRLYG